MSEQDEIREEREQLLKQTDESITMLGIVMKGEHIDWLRKSPTLRRSLTVYPDLLTPEQRQRLDELEQELLTLAYEAQEETTTKKILKKKSKPPQDEEPK